MIGCVPTSGKAGWLDRCYTFSRVSHSADSLILDLLSLSCVSYLPCSLTEPCPLSLPFDLILLLCFTFPIPLFLTVSFLSHKGHPGTLPRICFAPIFSSGLARTFQDNLSAR